ncbi:MAG: shikimate dehydrogenase [Myxococcota bacterium]
MNIDGSTQVYALVGHPVARSRSPELHNGWFAAFGVNAVYVALDVPGDGTGIVEAIRTLGLAGANVTVPHKAAVLPALDRVEPRAAELGAVNTILRDGDGLVGRNTDAPGWLADLTHRGISVAGRRTVVVGTGGAGRALAGEVLDAGVTELRLVNRTPERAEALRVALAGRHAAADITAVPWAPGALDDADLVVVATAGRPAALDRLDPGRCRTGAVWCDLDYRSPEPPSSVRARAAGCRVVDGRGMLWWQAALAFEAWTGFTPDPSGGSSTFWG